MIITLAELKTLLSITTSSDDSRLNLLISIADQQVRDFCRRNFEAAQYTDFYSSTGTRLVVLRQYPVISVQSVFEDYNAFFGQNPDGAFPPETELQQGVDYFVYLDGSSFGRPNSGVLVREGRGWLSSDFTRLSGALTVGRADRLGSIKVTYTAGYTTIPDSLKLAVANLVAIYRSQVSQSGPLVEEQLGRWKKKFSSGVVGAPGVSGQYLLPPSIQAILAPYRDMAF